METVFATALSSAKTLSIVIRDVAGVFFILNLRARSGILLKN